MNKKISFNMNQLKLFAMFFMLVDHFAYVMIERGIGLAGEWYTIDRVLRGMGRVSFPIFCFTIVVGYQKTRDAAAYLKRLFLFALISEIPFDLAFRGSFFDMGYQNVFWTLAFGLGAIMVYENSTITNWQRVLGLIACVCVPDLLHTDYSMYGVLTIFLMYMFRQEPIISCLAGYIVLLLQNQTEMWSVFGFLAILLYNGERGKGNKFFYYIYYPAHLILLVVLKPVIVGFLSGLLPGIRLI